MTGNSEGCADDLGKRLAQEGIEHVVESIEDVTPDRLKEAETLLMCIATWGEGEPPDTAIDLYDEVVVDAKLDLSNLKFSVLALGDTDYVQFCECGRAFDEALEKQGATRIAPRVDCDVDFEEPAAQWIESVVGVLKERAVATA